MHSFVLYYNIEKSGFNAVSAYLVKQIMHFPYIAYMATLYHKNPCSGVMKFKILVDPSLVIITIHLVGVNHAP